MAHTSGIYLTPFNVEAVVALVESDVDEKCDRTFLLTVHRFDAQTSQWATAIA
jgi:hypothetical protein